MMYMPSQDPRRVLSRALRKCPNPWSSAVRMLQMDERGKWDWGV